MYKFGIRHFFTSPALLSSSALAIARSTFWRQIPCPPLSFPVRVIVTDAMGQTGRRILTRLANSPRLSVTRMDVVANNTEANTQVLAGADSLVIVTKFVPRESPQDDRQDGQPGNNTARECPQNRPQLHM